MLKKVLPFLLLSVTSNIVPPWARACVQGCTTQGCYQLNVQPNCLGCIIAPTGSCTCTVTPIGHRCGTAVTQCGNCNNNNNPNCSDATCCKPGGAQPGTYGVLVGGAGLRFPDKTLAYQYAAQYGWIHDATLKDQFVNVSPYLSRAVEHLQQIAATSTCTNLNGKLLNPLDTNEIAADMTIVVSHDGVTVRVVDLERKTVDVLAVEGLHWTIFRNDSVIAEGYAQGAK